MSDTVYVKDLLELPERIHKGDFVLKLTEGGFKLSGRWSFSSGCAH
jgi:hypothetical protein